MQEEDLQKELRRHGVEREDIVPVELASWLFEDARNARAWLADRGCTLEFFLTLDASAHVAGGADPDSSAFRGLFDAILALDTGRAFGLAGGELVLGLQALGGDDGSAEVGVAQNYSNIDAAEDRVQLARFWYQHEWAEGWTSLRLGKMDANGQFARVEGAGRFLHASMGYSPTILGFPTYPEPAYGAALWQRLARAVSLGAGVFDGAGQEGVETGESGPRTLFGEPSDLFLIAELGGDWGRPSGAGRAALGAWRHTGDFARFDGGSEDGTAGLYAVLEQRVEASGRALELFLQLGQADDDVAALARHVGLGAMLLEPFLPERADALGIGLSRVQLSDAPGAGFEADAETALELNYGFRLLPGVHLKPVVQYVSDPGGDASVGDAWILTLRMTTSL